MSEGHEIRLGVVRPRTSRVLPGVLLYHGCTGVGARDDRLNAIAHTLAARGYAAVTVHYFDRTGTRVANIVKVLIHSEKWIQAVTDSLTFGLEQLGIDRDRVGTFGYSLGGFLAVAHAARDERVRTTVIVSGGIDPFTFRSVQRLPPMLLIHGDSDRRVPLARAGRLCRTLAKLGSPFQQQLFAGEGHIPSPRAFSQMLEVVPDFLDGQLRQSPHEVVNRSVAAERVNPHHL